MKRCCKEMDQQDIQNKKVNSSESQDKDAGWLSRLKNKWQVNNILQVVLILCTFAIGGSMCGYFGKKLMNLLHLENKFIWTIAYVLLVTILWPLCVLVVSIPFGQFRFFKKYLAKMGRRIAGKKK